MLAKNKSFTLMRFGISSSLVCIIATFLTFSRGVFLGLVVLSLFYFWQGGEKKLLSLTIICLVAFTLAASLHKKEPLGRFGFRRLLSGSHDSILSEYRLARIKMTAHIFKKHPFFGIGFQHFRLRFAEFCASADKKTPYEFMIPDNMYLTFLAETGIAGTLGFLVFISFLLRNGFSQLRKALSLSQTRQITIGLISALLGLSVNMGGYELFYWDNPFLLFALLCGFLAGDNIYHQTFQEG
jgi:O-antigen ligase